MNNNNNANTTPNNQTTPQATPITLASKKKGIQLTASDERLLLKKGFRVGEPLGSGAFACVCRATFNNQPCAVKVIDLEKSSEDYRLKFLPRELYTMKKLKHRYLIEVHDIFVVSSKVLIFMEIAEGGDFLDMLHQTKAPLREDKVKFYYSQFGDGLRYMHSIGFAHRDIKCENILLNKTRTMAKLTDFGFTRSCVDKDTVNPTQREPRFLALSDTYCGSTAYVAPEVLRSQPYNPLISDVWSMGIVVFVLLNNRLPFVERDNKRLCQAQMAGNYKFVNVSLSSECKDFIGQHLNPEAATRIKMAQVFHHKWLQDSSPTAMNATPSNSTTISAENREESNNSKRKRPNRMSRSLINKN